LLAELPAEVDGAPVELAAEVDQAVGGLDLDAELGHLAQQIAQLAEDHQRAGLQPLDRLRRVGVDLDLGTLQRVARFRQLLLDVGQLIAQLARAGELLAQRVEQRVGLAQRKETGGQRNVHAVHRSMLRFDRCLCCAISVPTTGPATSAESTRSGAAASTTPSSSSSSGGSPIRRRRPGA